LAEVANWIITFIPGTAASEIDAVAASVESAGGHIGHRYSGLTVLGFSCFNLPKPKLDTLNLLRNKHVGVVEADAPAQAIQH